MLIGSFAVSSGVLAASFETMVLVALWLNFSRSQRVLAQNRLNVLLVVGLCMHLFYICTLIFKSYAVVLNAFSIANIELWIMLLIAFLLQMKRAAHNLLLILLPLSVCVLVVSIYALPFMRIPLFLEHRLIVHIISSVLASSFLSMAACQAFLTAYQERQLRRHHTKTVLCVFPPLQTMEYLLFVFIWVGVFFLTLAFISGYWVPTNTISGSMKCVFFVLLGWLILATLLWGKQRWGWRGRFVTSWALVAFAFVQFGVVWHGLGYNLIFYN